MPLVWILQGRRVGDNLQLVALADALGWPYESKALDWRKPLARWTPWYGRRASLRHLTAQAGAGLVPPWPDLVLSIGWRSVPVARWIQRQSRARLVHLGRPRAPLATFDLVLGTPQYRLPEARNVVQLSGPVSTRPPGRLAAAADLWAPRLSHLPRPWIAVLVGGDAPPLRFPPPAAVALAEACNRLAAETGGSLLVATGPRTPPPSAEALRSALTAPSYLHEWGSDGDNPYEAFLALADKFVVTGDSISMAHEAAQRGQPLHVFPLPAANAGFHDGLRRLDRHLRREGLPLQGLYRRLLMAGVIYPPRSGSDYFEGLVERGRANLLGAPEVVPAAAAGPADSARAVRAVRALFADRDLSLPG